MRLRFLAGTSLLLGALLGVAVGFGGGHRPEAPSDAFDALASGNSPTEGIVLPALAVGDAAQQRPVYPFSIVPGGVTSVDELKRAIATDSVVRAHFANFDLSKTRVETLKAPRLAHVSYRIGPDVFWTKRPLLLKAGERVLTDGKHVARTRCANQVASQPLAVSPLEPLPVTLDTPVLGLRADASEQPRDLPPGVSIVPGPPAATTTGVTPGPPRGPGAVPNITGIGGPITGPSAGPSNGGVVTPGPLPGGTVGPNSGAPDDANGPSGPTGNPGNPSGPQGPPSGSPNPTGTPDGPTTPPGPPTTPPGSPNAPPGTPGNPPGTPGNPPGTPGNPTGNPNNPPPNTPFGPPETPGDPFVPPVPPGTPGDPFVPPVPPGTPDSPFVPPIPPGTPDGPLVPPPPGNPVTPDSPLTPPSDPGTPPGTDGPHSDPPTPAQVPEPGMMLLAGTGIVAAVRRLKARTSRDQA